MPPSRKLPRKRKFSLQTENSEPYPKRNPTTPKTDFHSNNTTTPKTSPKPKVDTKRAEVVPDVPSMKLGGRQLSALEVVAYLRALEKGVKKSTDEGGKGSQ